MPRGALTFDQYRGLRRFHALDGLRAISILLVIFAHSRNLTISKGSQGVNGVVLFFVLSGFLITSLLLREESKYGAVNLKAFIVRRAFRILPLYYAVLLTYVVLVLVLHFDARTHGFLEALPYYAGFFQEHVRFAPHPVGEPFLPFEVSWSLGIEEKFYFVWPIVAFGILSNSRAWRVPVAVLLAAITGLATVVIGSVGNYLVYYAALLSGCLVALLLHHERTYTIMARLGTRAGLTFAAVLSVGSYAVTYLQLFTDGWISHLAAVQLFPCLAVLLVGLVTTTTKVRDVFDWRPAVALGQASYAAYLLHLIFLNGAERVVPAPLGLLGDWLALVAGIIATVFASIVVQRHFEGPLTVIGHRIADRRYPRVPIGHRSQPV